MPTEEPQIAQPSTPAIVQSAIPSELLPTPRTKKFYEKNSPPEAPYAPSTPMQQSAMPTFSPTAPQQLLPPQPSTAGSAPLTPATISSPGNPWAYARERTHAPVGADFISCPPSAGVSDASTIPMQSVGATPPGLGQAASSSPAYACPAMGTPGYLPMQPMQGSGSGGRNPADEVCKDRAPIPKLVVKGGDPTTLTRVISEWIQKTTINH